MAPGDPRGAAASSGEEDAKEVLDKFGQKVHDQVKNGDAEKYIDYLKGYLYKANGHTSETRGTNDTCELVKEYRSKADTKSERYPCGNGSAKRFLVKQQAEYDNKKMKCSNGGACAPYRRLHLCDKNMVKMDTNNNDGKAKHKLLAEVCYAAKEEGDLIKTRYTPYQEIYKDTGSGSTMCTMLARSFADIGDIIRGKDLFLGYDKKDRKEKQKIQDNLKNIFAKIHKDVTSTNGKAAKERYQKDEKDGNYFQLREDWWYANRATVWKAITCSEQLKGDKYFRNTCNGVERTTGYCRCGDDKPGEDKENVDPPTYFDYVPQYLRWFEEWAEDFCRKKKKK